MLEYKKYRIVHLGDAWITWKNRDNVSRLLTRSKFDEIDKIWWKRSVQKG